MPVQESDAHTMAGDLEAEGTIAAAVLSTLDGAATRAGDKALMPELASILAVPR